MATVLYTCTEDGMLIDYVSQYEDALNGAGKYFRILDLREEFYCLFLKVDISERNGEYKVGMKMKSGEVCFVEKLPEWYGGLRDFAIENQISDKNIDGLAYALGNQDYFKKFFFESDLFQKWKDEIEENQGNFPLHVIYGYPQEDDEDNTYEVLPHLSIMLGPFIFECISHRIIFPKRIKNITQSPVSVMEVFTFEFHELEGVLHIISEKITLHNQHFNGKHLCNSIVSSVLDDLDIPFLKGPFHSIFVNMYSKGRSEKNSFTYALNGKEKSFRLHCILDQYYSEVVSNNEKIILESIDKAMWLRHLLHPQNNHYRPMSCMNGETCDRTHHAAPNDDLTCPFGDPTLNNTYYL
eukprot:TRINITY_DN3495_c0_g1_i1.p1 TRINITY_DN3495_c0_g1~~TRINITY_DN3495_c0_g1_i1.p1  ORF type:complete len:353 (+),score=65.17 TRINITY_DN3495_c0_g1_i1:280-1338(+)